MEAFGPFVWLVDQVRGWQQSRRRLRVLVHRAVFVGSSMEHYFIKVTNLSPRREVEITHIWFATEPPVHVLNPERPLPARLRLDETYESWIPRSELRGAPKPERLGRVQLSNGKVVKSRANKKVPPVGQVARGGIE